MTDNHNTTYPQFPCPIPTPPPPNNLPSPYTLFSKMARKKKISILAIKYYAKMKREKYAKDFKFQWLLQLLSTTLL